MWKQYKPTKNKPNTHAHLNRPYFKLGNYSHAQIFAT